MSRENFILRPDVPELMFEDFIGKELTDCFVMGVRAGMDMAQDINAKNATDEDIKFSFSMILKDSNRKKAYRQFFWNMLTIGEASKEAIAEKCTEEEKTSWFKMRDIWLEERRKQYPEFAKYIK